MTIMLALARVVRRGPVAGLGAPWFVADSEGIARHRSPSGRAEVTDLDEVAGKNVQEESADEFGRRDSGGIGAARAEDTSLVDGADQSRVADGHAVGGAAEVAKDLLRAAKDWRLKQRRSTDLAPGDVSWRRGYGALGLGWQTRRPDAGPL